METTWNQPSFRKATCRFWSCSPILGISCFWWRIGQIWNLKITMKKENIPIYSVILERSGLHQCSSMYPKAQLLIASISPIADLATPHFFFFLGGGVGTTVFPNPPVLGHQGIVTVIIPHLFGDDAVGQLSSRWGDQHWSCFQVDQISICDRIKYHSFGIANIVVSFPCYTAQF